MHYITDKNVQEPLRKKVPVCEPVRNRKDIWKYCYLLRRYCFDEEKQQRAAALMQQITAGQGAPSVGVTSSQSSLVSCMFL